MITSEEQKHRIIQKVIESFDFEAVRAIQYLTRKDETPVYVLKNRAELYLKRALEHQARDFWWIGGLAGFGGLCASWDDKWGLTLHYVAEASRITIKDMEKL